MGRHSRRGPAGPADAAGPAAAASHDQRGAAGFLGASRAAEAGGVQDADDSWSPWEPPPRPGSGAVSHAHQAHGRGGAPSSVRGGHPQEYGGPPADPGPREQGGGWDTWADQPRDLVSRTEGVAALGRSAPYYDTLDEHEHEHEHEHDHRQDRRHPGHRPSAEGSGSVDDPDDGDDLELVPLPTKPRPSRQVGPRRGVKGRLFTGALALAVLVVLGVTVSQQVADVRAGKVHAAQAAGVSGAEGEKGQPPGVTDRSPLPPAWNLEGLSYKQRMGLVYDLSATLEGPGTFTSVPGTDEPPREGDEFTYRVDIEDELGLDGELFADAVHKTLNDGRSWAHDGLTFRRVPKSADKDPDFVITLASPGTTAEWCAKSGLDTTVDNVSCDSASTSRVMINAYRWARGSETYGDRFIHSYRQMLINHEVGHRLGYGHVECAKDGGLAPVMQQQTKFLDHDGIHCRPNAWAYPNG